MTSFYQSPQYLKGIRKIQSMQPEDRAVTQHLIDSLSGAYAGADMAKQLQAMKAASLEKERERSLDLAGRRLDLAKTLGEGRLGLQKDYADTRRSENKTAENLGYANLALSGLTGYTDYRNKKNLTKKLSRLVDLYK